jgi:hypothetical protein
VGHRDRETGKPLLEEGREAALVRRVGECKEQADSDGKVPLRLCGPRGDPRSHALELLVRERRHDGAARREALADTEAVGSRHERLRLRPPQVVGSSVDPPDRGDVLEAPS